MCVINHAFLLGTTAVALLIALIVTSVLIVVEKYGQDLHDLLTFLAKHGFIGRWSLTLHEVKAVSPWVLLAGVLLAMTSLILLGWSSLTFRLTLRCSSVEALLSMPEAQVFLERRMLFETANEQVVWVQEMDDESFLIGIHTKNLSDEASSRIVDRLRTLPNRDKITSHGVEGTNSSLIACAVRAERSGIAAIVAGLLDDLGCSSTTPVFLSIGSASEKGEELPLVSVSENQ